MDLNQNTWCQSSKSAKAGEFCVATANSICRDTGNDMHRHGLVHGTGLLREIRLR